MESEKTPQATTSMPNAATMLRVGWILPELAFLCTVGSRKGWNDATPDQLLPQAASQP
uniref:hypothetical protein n=1 Tax=Bacteroides uniformis TaxID=820 RepID=UPI004026CB09